MNIICIKEPIWGTKSVGVAEYKMTDEFYVEIIYRDRYGNKVYPFYYKMTKEKAKYYPLQIIKGTKLRIIPINDFKKYKLKDK